MIRRPLSKDAREYIGRAALIGLGLFFAIPATALTVTAFRLACGLAESGNDPQMTFVLLVPALFLYVIAGSFLSFAFCAWRKDRSKPVRTLAIANGIRELFEGILP